MLVETIVASIIPIAAEGLKQGIGKLFGGVKPVTIEDQIKLDKSEIERAQAIASLDSPGGTPSQWVVDLRASSRYIAAWGCIGLGSYMLTNADLKIIGTELIGVAFGFLFGTRIVAGWKK